MITLSAFLSAHLLDTKMHIFSQKLSAQRKKSGLDYSKIAIIKDMDYFDLSTKAIVDQDEFNEMMKNLPVIVQKAIDYVDTYINHVNGAVPVHPREFSRKYQYSALIYFHDIKGIWKPVIVAEWFVSQMRLLK